jgi:hypothetical protein
MSYSRREKIVDSVLQYARLLAQGAMATRETLMIKEQDIDEIKKEIYLRYFRLEAFVQ